MIDYTPALIAAVATLTGAALAAYGALLVAVLTKESKTSELRQQWVDALRTDLAELLSAANVIRAYINLANPDTTTVEGRKALFVESREILATAMAIEARIELRLNPVEHVVLIDLIDKVIELQVKPMIDKQDKELAILEKALVAEAQRVLRTR